MIDDRLYGEKQLKGLLPADVILEIPIYQDGHRRKETVDVWFTGMGRNRSGICVDPGRIRT